MPFSASQLRSQIEGKLARRIPGALSPRVWQAPERFPVGIAEIDALLSGGIPRGGLTEISGNASTGRTTLAISCLAQLTQQALVCAWLDVHDAFDLESAAANGVQLNYLLWVRAGERCQRNRDCGIQHAPSRQAFIRTIEGGILISRSQGQHPRQELRGIERAVSQLFQKSAETPVWAKPELSYTQTSKAVPGDKCSSATRDPGGPTHRLDPKPWLRLEQALKSLDLLLYAGGFTALVLDMGDVRQSDAARIPLATWHRFRLAAEQSQSALLVLSRAHCARSCAALLLDCERVSVNPCFSPQSQDIWAAKGASALFEGTTYRLTLGRQRAEGTEVLHDPQAQWSTKTTWSQK